MTIDRAAASLQRLDQHPMDHTDESVVACVVLRNEVDRLSGLLEHHRRLGVECFFVVDNGSSDGTVERLLTEPDVRLWTSAMPFREADYGASWFAAILREHAPTNWVVIIDADELLWYADCETRPISELCAQLDRDGHRGMSGVLLDLYPTGPLAENLLPADRSPLEVARWFDRRWCHRMAANSGPYENQVGLFGGVRRRLFGGSGWDYCLSKVPLLRYGPDTVLVGGQHWSNLPLAPDRAAVLHFKLDARLVDLAWSELERGQRATHAQEYHAYAEALALHPQLCAFDPEESLEFTGSATLLELGIIGPIADPEEARIRVGALMTQAEVRIASGDTDRALALLDRAAAIQPTGVAAVLRTAALHRAAGDGAAAARAFTEACARRPDDLQLLALAAEDIGRRPFWSDELGALLSTRDSTLVVDHEVESHFGCTSTFGFERPVYETAWIGFSTAVVSPTRGLHPYAHYSLPTLFDAPEFVKSLDSCRALFTFTEYGATWMRARTDVPVFVVPQPVTPATRNFDLNSFLKVPEVTILQPGHWLSDLNAICDLPVRDGDRPVRRIRCVEHAHHALATALARAQRELFDRRADPEALRSTIELGGLDPDEIENLRRNAVVLAPLLDATADPVLSACLADATPVLAPRIPGVIELLGADYPLLFDTLADAAELATNGAAITAAHDQLLMVRSTHTLDAFLAAVNDALTEVGQP